MAGCWYPSQEYHVLRASLLCDVRSIPLLSWIISSEKQQNAQIQQAFLNALATAVNPQARVIIVTDAGFQNAWFRHIKILGGDFIRKAIYTTNAIESLNSVIRSAIKKRKVYPTDDSVRKVVYLAINDTSKNGVCRSRTDVW